MNDLSEKIIKKIEAEKIKPFSKWRFAGLSLLIWFMFAVSILVGSIGAAVSIFLIKNADWDLYGHFGHSFTEFTLLILPWFWFVFIVTFTLLSYFYYRKTGKGYKMNTLKVVLLSVILSISAGIILSLTSVPEKIETIFDKNMPGYSEMHKHRHIMWMNPEKGFLAGTIEETPEKSMIILKDLNGKDWQVDISKTDWRGRLGPVAGTKIKITGTLQQSANGSPLFKAVEIRPWHGRGMGRMNGQHRGRMNHGGMGKKGH